MKVIGLFEVERVSNLVKIYPTYTYCSRLVVVVGVFGGIALVLPFGGLERDLLHGAFGMLYQNLGRRRRPTSAASG